MNAPLTFTVPGVPRGKKRPRVVRRKARLAPGGRLVRSRGGFTLPETAEYEATIAALALHARGEWSRWHGIWSLSRRYRIRVRAYFAPRRRRRADGSNILKAVEDALQAVLYLNDGQLAQGTYEIADDPNERIDVQVEVVRRHAAPAQGPAGTQGEG